MEQRISVGRIVLFGLGKDRDGKVVERPAIVVQDWGTNGPGVNLQVFTDSNNDDALLREDEGSKRLDGTRSARSVVWRTSVLPADDQAVGQENRWRWPPRVSP